MGRRVLCIDLGASSGRAMLAEYDGERIALTEVHRFKNKGIDVNGTLYWDILSIYNKIKSGLVKARLSGDYDSIGIDTWGVDYAVIDGNGQLMGDPVQYRDRRTAGMIEEAEKKLSTEKLYRQTGIQLMEINTVFQLLADLKNRPYIAEYGSAVLNIPDLLAYMLTGEISSELSIASTTQLFSPVTMDWIPEKAALGIPDKLLHRIVRPGESKGMLRESICEELRIPAAEVVAVCGHDTQCASFAVPASENDFIFLSSGTWSLLGTVTDKPVINESSYSLGLSNEVGYGGRINLLKNITGLWIVQQIESYYELKQGRPCFSWLEESARSCSGFTAFIDPDDPVFSAPGNMQERVKEYCRRTGQNVPESIGEVMRTVYLSLAMKYRLTVEQISGLTGKTYGTIYMVGGGTRDRLLCSLTADVCGMRVSAGPVEATALGNAAIQLLKAGEIKEVSDVPGIISRSDSITIYEPSRDYDKEYARFREVTGI
ncbi:MAG: rhamnulokinase [Ruminococcus sp.]|nr:rhamnulokinase [Ruminococcus sp.]